VEAREAQFAELVKVVPNVAVANVA
jgi:hypothetical protein